MKAITETRLRWMARTCEKSNVPSRKCECRCGGLLHGQPHDEVWIAETLTADRLRCQIDPAQDDWVGFHEFARFL